MRCAHRRRSSGCATRDSRPAATPGSFALAIVVVVAPIVLLGKAFAAGQPVLAGHATIYTAIMMLVVSTGTSLRASDSPLGRAIRSVTRLAVAFTTLGVAVCWMVEPTSLGAVLTPDLRPLLLAVVTVALATVFAGVSRLLRLR